jgi:uncharacterized protein (TIGR03545 family)
VGRDIPFPFKYKWPAFHLKLAEVTGRIALDKPGLSDLDYAGTVKDVTNDPPLVGRPIVAQLRGASGAQAMTLEATFDYTQPESRERFQFSWKGIPLAGMKLGDVGGPVTVSAGSGAVAADLALAGENISGRIDLRGEPLRLAQTPAPEAAGQKMYALLNDALGRIDKAEATLLVSDTLTSPNLKLQTTLDNQIKNALSGAASKELAEAKAKLKARVDSLVGERQKELSSLIGSQSNALTGALSGKEKNLGAVQDQLRRALDELKSKGTSGLPIPGGSGSGDKPLPDLKKLFKKK